LANGLIRLSTPENFNDPYDTKVVFTKLDLKSIHEAIENYFIELQCRAMIDNCYRDNKFGSKIRFILPKIRMKFHEYINQRRREFRPRKNYVKLIKLIDRMRIKNGAEGSESQESFNLVLSVINSKTIEGDISKHLDDAFNNLYISCFSKKDDSILMWAHYANNNKGVCLEFENEDFLDVQYSRKRKPIRISGIMPKVLWNWNTNEQLNIDEKLLRKYLPKISPLLTKSRKWEYEQEVRCIINGKNPKLIQDKDGYYYYHMKRIKSLTLGCRISESDKAKILALVKNLKIGVYQIKLTKDSFGLIKEKIICK